MEIETLRVTGMTCGGCISNVTRALQAVSGVEDVKVSLPAGEATVRYDDRRTSAVQLRSAVKNAGYGVGVPSAATSAPTKGGCCG